MWRINRRLAGSAVATLALSVLLPMLPVLPVSPATAAPKPDACPVAGGCISPSLDIDVMLRGGQVSGRDSGGGRCDNGCDAAVTFQHVYRGVGVYSQVYTDVGYQWQRGAMNARHNPSPIAQNKVVYRVDGYNAPFAQVTVAPYAPTTAILATRSQSDQYYKYLADSASGRTNRTSPQVTVATTNYIFDKCNYSGRNYSIPAPGSGANAIRPELADGFMWSDTWYEFDHGANGNNGYMDLPSARQYDGIGRSGAYPAPSSTALNNRYPYQRVLNWSRSEWCTNTHKEWRTRPTYGWKERQVCSPPTEDWWGNVIPGECRNEQYWGQTGTEDYQIDVCDTWSVRHTPSIATDRRYPTSNVNVSTRAPWPNGVQQRLVAHHGCTWPVAKLVAVDCPLAFGNYNGAGNITISGPEGRNLPVTIGKNANGAPIYDQRTVYKTVVHPQAPKVTPVGQLYFAPRGGTTLGMGGYPAGYKADHERITDLLKSCTSQRYQVRNGANLINSYGAWKLNVPMWTARCYYFSYDSRITGSYDTFIRCDTAKKIVKTQSTTLACSPTREVRNGVYDPTVDASYWNCGLQPLTCKIRPGTQYKALRPAPASQAVFFTPNNAPNQRGAENDGEPPTSVIKVKAAADGGKWTFDYGDARIYTSSGSLLSPSAEAARGVQKWQNYFISDESTPIRAGISANDPSQPFTLTVPSMGNSSFMSSENDNSPIPVDRWEQLGFFQVMRASTPGKPIETWTNRHFTYLERIPDPSLDWFGMFADQIGVSFPTITQVRAHQICPASTFSVEAVSTRLVPGTGSSN